MKKLNKSYFPFQTKHPVKVIQFGEGNFMRAFVDWQIQQMNNQNIFNGHVSIVQPINQGLGNLLKEQDYLYTVILEGLLEGEVIESKEIITVIDSVINPYETYDEYLNLANIDTAEFIISNTTEAGIQYLETDNLNDQPQQSFPGKLTALLYKRFQLKKPGFTIIPCELIDRNGDKLKEIVLTYAKNWNLGSNFIEWINTENTFCCSLVDRIVPGYPREIASCLNKKYGYIDNVMVKAEPFHLWVIEGPESLKDRLPLQQAGLNVILTSDMTPYRERKVHLLNGPHTAMVPLALLANIETVEEVMKDIDFRLFIDNLFSNELIPMLSLPKDELNLYTEQIKERFLNPFVNHKLTAISLNSISKFKSRLLPVLLNYQKNKGTLPPYMTVSLASLILLYRGDQFTPTDDEIVLKIFEKSWSKPESVVYNILSSTQLWGIDLTTIPELTMTIEKTLQKLMNEGPRNIIKTINIKGEI